MADKIENEAEDTETGDNGEADTSSESTSDVPSGEQEEETKSTGTPEDKSKDEKSDNDDKSEDGDKGDKDKSDDDDKSDDKEEKEGAPEEYEPFDLPEEVKVDDALLTDFTDYAREHDLSQEEAQALVDLHLKAADKFETRIQEQWDEKKAEWREQTKADKELQGEDGTVDEALALSKKAVEKLGGEELMEVFDLTGTGEHPAVIKAFYKLGQYIKDDEFVFGSAAQSQKSRAERMFPSMKK